MKKLFELELNEKEAGYFEFVRFQALRGLPNDLLSQIKYHENIVERAKELGLQNDEGLRVEFYEAIIKYLNNMLVVNF